jgi:DNA-directed RNA polymerase subunit alpha
MLITQRPVISQEKVTDTRYRFTMEPLEPGFGYTIGNSLRRTLLGSIPGAAVTSIKIDGVRHEFETKDGVKEDVTEIILNVKKLVVSSEIDEPVTVYLSTSKPGPVLAGEIKTSAGIEIHNKDLKIATLSKGTLDIEFVIERGRGYISADDNKKLQPNVEVDRIVIDSIYTPVLNVKYNVEATRVGQHTNFDKLILDVETKPSISPVDAVASAGKTLVELFGLVHRLNADAEGVEIGEEITSFEDLADNATDESIDILDLPLRAQNNLRHNNILTVSELVALTEKDLAGMKSMGATSIAAIKDSLSIHGLKLNEEKK